MRTLSNGYVSRELKRRAYPEKSISEDGYVYMSALAFLIHYDVLLQRHVPGKVLKSPGLSRFKIKKHAKCGVIHLFNTDFLLNMN